MPTQNTYPFRYNDAVTGDPVRLHNQQSADIFKIYTWLGADENLIHGSINGRLTSWDKDGSNNDRCNTFPNPKDLVMVAAPFNIRAIPGFRVLTDNEHWENENFFSRKDIKGGWRPILQSDWHGILFYPKEFEYFDSVRLMWSNVYDDYREADLKDLLQLLVFRTKRPLPASIYFIWNRYSFPALPIKVCCPRTLADGIIEYISDTHVVILFSSGQNTTVSYAQLFLDWVRNDADNFGDTCAQKTN